MIVDFCAYLGEWLTWTLHYRSADGLLYLMDRSRVDAACVSLASGMFRYDAREANERLCHQVEGHRNRLWPIGTVNPSVSTWREDVQDGLERLGLVGYRIHPAYHGYTLDSPPVLELAAVLARAGCPLFVALYVDEERFQHPAIRVPDVPIDEIQTLIACAPDTTVVLNSLKTLHASTLFESGIALDRVYLDVDAMDQDFEGLYSLVTQFGVERLVYGSQMPFLYPEAARMVVEYSGLSEADIEAILVRNWRSSPVLARLQHAEEAGRNDRGKG
jgi:predicted TIM-barrel fold metal-dependent hydrolase